MRVLVAGGRRYSDFARVCRELDRLGPVACVLHGGARGADRLAELWAAARGVPCVAVPADWRRLGRAAGPVRNRAMLALGVDLVLAFPGGPGTAGLIALAREAGVRVRSVAEPAQLPLF
jgi:hypothetical protein